MDLPHGFEERTCADSLVVGDQRQSLGAGRAADDAIGGIVRKVGGEERTESADFGGNRAHGNALQEHLNRGLQSTVGPYPPLGQQRGNFPNCDRGDRQTSAWSRSADRRCGGSRKLLGIDQRPNQSVGVHENQSAYSHTSGGSASRSPTISITPLSLPMNSRFAFAAGTNFATGFPRLVINKVSPVLPTSSISVRQRALNSAA